MNKSNFLTLCLVFILFSYKVVAEDNADIPPDSNVTEPDKLLDDMLYELDYEGDSRVPPLLIPRGKENDYVRLPNKEGEFEIASRAAVEESRRLATVHDKCLYTKLLLYPRGYNGESVEFKREEVASLPARYGFNLDYDTKILCHGFISDSGHEVMGPLAKEFQDTDDFNLIGADWSEGAKTDKYEEARYRVPNVAKCIAEVIDAIIDLGQEPSQIGLIGHSLGAHIVGLAGKQTKHKVGSVIGLDPAGPLFRLAKEDERISKGDGKYVEVVHTNAKTFGIYQDIGDVDIYVNGGLGQPGCLTSICSHQRAVHLFKESLTEQNLYARRCPDLKGLSEKCSLEKTFLGGYNLIKLQKKVKGVYYMPTAPNAPYIRYV